MRSFVVINYPEMWDFRIRGVEVIPAKEYLTNKDYSRIKGARIYNLCRSYKYQSTGYYVSLLAEARGHRVFPSVSTIQDFKHQSIIRSVSEEIDDLIQRNLSKIKSKEFDLSIYFGKNVAKQYDKLSRHLYNFFQAPLIRAHFINNRKWILSNISPISNKEIPDFHRPYVEQFASNYFARKRITPLRLKKALYSIAILVDPTEEEPPSNKVAVRKFMRSAEEVGLNPEMITRHDFSRILEFDALFIRTTTAVNHYTYRFSRKAHREGLAVIDDPDSILKCTNKVFLSELLSRAGVPSPKTVIIHNDNKETISRQLGFPCVLKKPDGSFSKGVSKISNPEELTSSIDKLLVESDLIIAQKYMPTEFDWRIGVLDGRPLYACKYHMAEGHWQIYNRVAIKSSARSGDVETIPVSSVPEIVVTTALKAANLIGSGLYGVDLKQVRDRAYVIEVNDNPNIDNGYEDRVLKDNLYLRIMRSFLRKIRELKKR